MQFLRLRAASDIEHQRPVPVAAVRGTRWLAVAAVASERLLGWRTALLREGLSAVERACRPRARPLAGWPSASSVAAAAAAPAWQQSARSVACRACTVVVAVVGLAVGATRAARTDTAAVVVVGVVVVAARRTAVSSLEWRIGMPAAVAQPSGALVAVVVAAVAAVAL